MDVQNINSYLTFQLDSDIFSVNVSKVVEIVEIPKITKVPQAPTYMKGVINLRGSVLPVVDTRMKFGFAEKEHNIDTSIIVMEISINKDDNIVVGAIVDKVLDVLEFSSDTIQPSPSIGSKYKPEFILGMGKSSEGNFVMILDIDKVFSTDELVLLSNTK